MLRLFRTNEIRDVQELEGDWDFQPIDGTVELPSVYRYRMPVPGCWEMHPQFTTYRGKVVYRRTVEISQKGPIRLVFKGVSHTDEFNYAIYILPSIFTALYCPWYIVKGKESIKNIHFQYRCQTDSQIEQAVTDQIKIIVFFTTPLFLIVIYVGNIFLERTKFHDLDIKFDHFFFPVLISVGLLRGLVEWITFRTKYAAND